MRNEYYYVYCNGLLGVKTNAPDFKWVYGCVAPFCQPQEYEKCVVKFDITFLPEKDLEEPLSFDDRFQSFMWDKKSHTVFYRRTMFSKLRIGYNIKISDNKVEANIGKNYLRFVKQRMMNLHAAYYLLSDVANIMLLKNGYLTLYASAVHYTDKNRGVVCFAPPNTGKITTAMKLCERTDYSFVSEDIVITDTSRLYSCPYTSSYRAQKSADSSGSYGRVRKLNSKENLEVCDLTDLVLLSRTEERPLETKKDFLRYIQILNGYLFNYYSSPIVKVLGYFDENYGEMWNRYAEKMLGEMVENCNCHPIRCEDFTQFDSLVHSKVAGEEL